jgi:hypothetical protein
MANYNRCHVCNKFGSDKLDGYCKDHAPAIADCPVCGARGYPRYENKCKRCAGVEEEHVPLRRDTFYPSKNWKEEPHISEGDFPALEKDFTKEPSY